MVSFEAGDKGTVVLVLAVALLLPLVVEKSKGPPSKLTGTGRNLKFWERGRDVKVRESGTRMRALVLAARRCIHLLSAIGSWSSLCTFM